MPLTHDPNRYEHYTIVMISWLISIPHSSTYAWHTDGLDDHLDEEGTGRDGLPSHLVVEQRGEGPVRELDHPRVGARALHACAAVSRMQTRGQIRCYHLPPAYLHHHRLWMGIVHTQRRKVL